MNLPLFYQAAFTLLAVLGLSSPPCHAEWLETVETGVYQDTSGHVKVIVGSKSGAQGIFVLSGPAVPVQLFNLEQTPAENVTHAFIRFDGSAQPPVYSDIVVGERSYKISGNLTLQLDQNTTIGIDNNNPYLTIVSEHDRNDPSILGFSGLNEVVRATGLPATILAANQLNPAVAKVIRPYSLKNGELFVSEQSVGTGRVGTLIRPDNECLRPGSIVLGQAQLQAIRTAKTEQQRAAILEQYLSEAKKSSPLKGYLVLKAEPSGVILLNVKSQDVASLSGMPSASSGQKLCVLAPLPLS